MLAYFMVVVADKSEKTKAIRINPLSHVKAVQLPWL